MLYLIRHAEAVGNAQGRIMGQQDLPLTERGRTQAQALATYLAASGIRLTSVFTSDLQRAADTARAVAAGCGGGLRVRADLREIGMGDLEGLTYLEAGARRGRSEPIRRAEPAEAIRTRVARGGAELVGAARAADVAAVTHGGTLAHLLRFLLELPALPGPGAPSIRHDNTGVSVLSFGPDGTRLLCLNTLYHLVGAVPGRAP